MNTARILPFFSMILSLLSASPVSMIASVARSFSVASRPGGRLALVTRSDDDHLCYAPTDAVFEYGNQTRPDEIASDCDKLSQKIKDAADQQGNFTELCGPPSGFALFNSEGNCSMWFECYKTTEGDEVTMGYDDIADIIKLATDGLRSSSLSDNSSILSVRTSMYCQPLKADWIVAFNSSDSGIGTQEEHPAGQLWKITSNFSPSGELHQ